MPKILGSGTFYSGTVYSGKVYPRKFYSRKVYSGNVYSGKVYSRKVYSGKVYSGQVSDEDERFPSTSSMTLTLIYQTSVPCFDIWYFYISISL